MKNSEIQVLLDQLFDFQCQVDALELTKQAERNKILTPELKAQLDALDAEFASKADAAKQNILELTARIKGAVLEAGATVDGDKMKGVFVRGRVSWNDKALLKYSKTHKEIIVCRDVGEPSVQIRKV